jgi:Protein of unknown function (DUF3551)
LPTLRDAPHFADLFVSERVDWRGRQVHATVEVCPASQPENRSMRISASIPLTIATLALATAAVAPRPAAAAHDLPWCASYYENNVTSCAFTSWEQCFATVAGPVGGHCTLNPAYPFRHPYVERHRKGRYDRYSGVR